MRVRPRPDEVRSAELARQLQSEEDERAYQLREAQQRAREQTREDSSASRKQVSAAGLVDGRKPKKKGDCIIM